MQDSIFQGFFHIFDLSFGIMHQQFSANIDISCIYGGKKWNISILEKIKNVSLRCYRKEHRFSCLKIIWFLTSICLKVWFLVYMQDMKRRPRFNILIIWHLCTAWVHSIVLQRISVLFITNSCSTKLYILRPWVVNKTYCFQETSWKWPRLIWDVKISNSMSVLSLLGFILSFEWNKWKYKSQLLNNNFVV